MWMLLLTAFATESVENETEPMATPVPTAAAPAPVDPEADPAPPTSALVVFTETPSPQARLKVVRYAMRKNKALQGGKDWWIGRAAGKTVKPGAMLRCSKKIPKNGC